MRARRHAGLIGVLLCVLAWPPGQAAAATTVTGSAGVGGVAKAGRWIRMLVTIEHGGPDLESTLIVTWGSTTLRRQVRLASGPPRAYELYIRAADAAPAIHVTVVDPGGTVHADAVLPIRMLRHDEPITVCVAALGSLLDPSIRCSGVLHPGQLPRSHRGYDAVDEVIWAPGAPAPSGEERGALDRWRTLRRLESSGDLALMGQVTRPTQPRGLPRDTVRVTVMLAAVYAALLGAAGFAFGVRGRPLRWVLCAAGSVVLAGCGAALLVGRVGSGSQVQLRHSSVLQQIPGSDRALLTTRAIAQFPAFADYRLTLPIEDAVIEQTDQPERVELAYDDGGRAEIAGVFGMGARKSFALEGTIPLRLFEVNDTGETIAIINRSRWTLHGCRFAPGYSRSAIGSLSPGGGVTAEREGDVTGPVFSCRLADTPFRVLHDEHDVRSAGDTVVAVYRTRGDVANAGAGTDD